MRLNAASVRRHPRGPTASGPLPHAGDAASPTGALLEAAGLTKSFGGVRAVRGRDIRRAAGETLGLIGPNGAGKTTTFELLGGFTKLDEGRVALRRPRHHRRSAPRRAAGSA